MAFAARISLKQNLINCRRFPPFINSGFLTFYSTAHTYQNLLIGVAGAKNNVGIIQLNRPKALNVFHNAMILELAKALKDFDADVTIATIIITGKENLFSAGTDIKEKLYTTYSLNNRLNHLKEWDKISNCSKPIIAAVNGYVLGFGCELCMMCDIVYAGESAKFGQPGIKVGTIPGQGGTQRLPRFVGKSKAMEMVLTGNSINAREAERMGLVSRVFPVEKLLDEAVKLAERIGTHSPLIVKMAKDAVNQAYETTLHSGVEYEKSIFCGTFGTEDRKEGMTAFIQKRPPYFKNN